MIRCGQTDTIKTLSTVTAKNVIVWLLQRRAEEGAVSFFKGPLENSIHSCPMDLQKEREPSIEICARWLHRGLCLLGVGYSEPRTALTVTLGSMVSNDTLIRSYFSFSFWQWCLRERAKLKKKKCGIGRTPHEEIWLRVFRCQNTSQIHSFDLFC